MAWIGLALRRLRDDGAATAGLALLILVTALIAALSPRALARFADDAVRSEVASAPSEARNIQLLQQLLIAGGPDDDPLSFVRDAGLQREQTFPASVRSLIADRSVTIDSGRFRVVKATTDPAFVRLRIQEGVEPYLHYVEGVPPTATVTTRNGVGPEKQNGVPVYEAAVSAATAKRFGLSLGETLTLQGDPGDPLIGRGSRDALAFATLTGIYEVTQPNADFWLDDPTLVHPVIRALSSEVQLLDAALLLNPATNDALARAADDGGRVLRYTWRSFLDPSRLTDRALDRTITAFRQLQVQYPSANVTPAADTALRTGMLPVLEAHRARWDAAQSIVAVIALGPAVVAVGTLALIAVLAARRRRATMALARSRGATGRQVLVPVLVEALLIALPGAVIAAIAAALLVPAGRTDTTGIAAAAVVAVAVTVIVGTVLGIARGTGADRGGAGARVVTDATPRRLLLEGLFVAAAIAAALLLRQRGLAAVGEANEGSGFDPLVAAVPALVGIAAGIVVLRLYRVPLAVVAWLAARGRGLVAMLAARRAREGGAGAAVLLVLLATATVGAFAVTALDHLDRGADVAAWQEVGAAYRLQQPSGPLPNGLDPASLPGVEAAAGVFQALVPVSLTGPQALVVMPEARALTDVLAGTPVAPDLPPGFETPAPGPIPAIVSRSLADSPRGVGLGETFTLNIEGYNLTYKVAEVRDSFPGVPLGRHFVVVAREAFLGQAPPARVVPVYGLLRAPADDAGAIRGAVDAFAPSVAVTGQAAVAVGLRAQPVTNAVRALILAAALVTAAYAALGVAAALALAGLARTQEVAQLRTLGLTARQTVQLTAAEHGPTTVAAFVLGALLGVGLFLLLQESLGLAALVGSPVSIPLALDPAQLLLILVVLVVVVGVGLLLGVTLQRRVAPTAAIRGRFE